MAFKPGDRVQHITGGPAMAIEGDHFEGGYMCSWFDRNWQSHCKRFPDEVIKAYEEPPSSSPLPPEAFGRG